MGTDGEQHQYTGQTPSGGYTYDPDYPPANTGGAAGGAGQGGSMFADGLVNGLSAEIGNAREGSLVLSAAAIGALYLAGFLAPGAALVALLVIAGADLAFGAATTILGGIEDAGKKALDQFLNLIGLPAGTSLGDSVRKVSGLLVDGTMVSIGLGAAYFLSKDKNGGRSVRKNPARIRHRRMKRVRPL